MISNSNAMSAPSKGTRVDWQQLYGRGDSSNIAVAKPAQFARVSLPYRKPE